MFRIRDDASRVSRSRPETCEVSFSVEPAELWRIGWDACPGCGSFAIGRGAVCGVCEHALLSKARPAISLGERWTHRYLFDWVPGEDDVLSNLILALKGAGSSRAWERWADIFLQKHAEHLPRVTDLVFVVAPHVDPDAPDHSAFFARGLARRLGLTVSGRPLLKGSGRLTRKLSKSERFRRKDLVKNADYRRSGGKRFVLIDDVLTTGATARAVRQALGAPALFEVWSLAARGTSSCGALSGVIGI